MSDEIAERQRAAAFAFFSAAGRADAAGQLAVMDDSAAYWSVDGHFNRYTYTGKAAIERFLNTFYSQAKAVEYNIQRVASSDDIVMVEWADAASVLDGSEYENQGVMIFEFVPGSDRVRSLRSYFDWKPLLEHASWRASMLEHAESDRDS
jgi:ketosteroid isomerase-like protein